MAGIGHNQGPTMERGASWRRHCWRTARAELLPQMPLNVIRRRVKRARELGLDYKTYASFRAATGRDIVALLFSSNALRVIRPGDVVPETRHAHLIATRGVEHRVIAQPPLDPDTLVARLAGQGIDVTAVVKAPGFQANFPTVRAAMDRVRGTVPGDAVLLIGDTAIERGWCAAGKLAGFVPSERYFGA
ncbi:hypothetical protein [Actibacterium sp. 188UL27-1]|uniref:hypothetical protein n=1 Tax=Actibacterium sp. 188UL27-1 TaxID=2786961 RepID=UPI001959B6F1|nr:hypothetical protein [Actibacterium sp. 188UL27-1]MBM7068465.1 hypothetical protein [Actibacterium sp. 188UL27-1]